MAVSDLRQRTGWLLLSVVIGHILLISAQVNTRNGVPILESVIFGTFSEVQRAATSAVGGVQEGWQNYFALQEIRRANERLLEENSQLQLRLQQERALAAQSRALQELLDLKNRVEFATTAGMVVQSTVIGGGAAPEFRTVTIDKGAQDGLKKDMAVLAPGGVVGRVILPTARASKVQLLIDVNAGAGAVVERSRAQGIVVGDGRDKLRMDYVPGSADIKAGDVVVTSGIEGIYPKGFVIGQIESVRRGAGQYSEVVVRPAVDFSALEVVLVALAPPPVTDPEATEQEVASQ
jgi:rod shape-determining protein MreC